MSNFQITGALPLPDGTTATGGSVVITMAGGYAIDGPNVRSGSQVFIVGTDGLCPVLSSTGLPVTTGTEAYSMVYVGAGARPVMLGPFIFTLTANRTFGDIVVGPNVVVPTSDYVAQALASATAAAASATSASGSATSATGSASAAATSATSASGSASSAGTSATSAGNSATAAADSASSAAASATTATNAATGATGSAASAAASAAAMVATTDAAMQPVLANPASASSETLSTTFAPTTLVSQVVSGFVAPAWDTLTTTSDVPVAILADGVMYGRNGTLLEQSTDGGDTWTTIRDLTSTPGELITLKDTTGGEVLIVCATQIYRTSGWASNKLTAILTPVLAAPGISSFYQWGVDTNPATGTCTAATYVGTTPYNYARYIWISLDGGITWTVRFDVNDHAAEAGGTIADCHTHNTVIDPWANDRIWFTWHRASVLGSGRIMYSDDKGLTWTRLDTSQAGSGSSQPTAAIALRNGIVFASDEQPNGIYVVTRTPDPADMVYKFAWRWPANATGVAGFGQWSSRTPDGSVGYIAFSCDVGFSPVLVQSDGITASLMPTVSAVNATSLGDGYRTVLYDDTRKRLIAVDRRAGVYQTTRARRTTARTGQVTPALDPGWALGGSSWGIRSLALHPTSTTTAARSVAAGSLSSASSTDTVAIGDSAVASGSGGSALGASSSATGTNSTAVGFSASATVASSTSLGNAAAATGTNSTAVGANSSAMASNATAVGKSAMAGSGSVTVGAASTSGASCVTIGQAAVTNADLSTVIGHAASGGGAYSTVIGESASVFGTIQKGVAIGHAATVASGHTSSIALGEATTTTASSQLQIGPRHFEMGAITAPAAAAAGTSRLYTVDDGSGHMRLALRLPSGAERALWTETHGPCLKSGGGTLNSSGQLTVADANITATSVIRVMPYQPAGTPGGLYLVSKTAGVGFVIGSTSTTDASVVRYEIESYS